MSHIDARTFSSGCIIPAARIQGTQPVPTVAIPVDAVEPPPTGLRLEHEDGVVRRIVLKCHCGQEHRVQIEYVSDESIHTPE